MASNLRCASAGLVLALSLGALPAAAQSASSSTPSAKQKKAARSLMADGRGLRSQNEPLKAMAKFAAADAIMHVPPTALELAKSQVGLGLLVQADSTLIRLQAMPVDPDEPEQFAEARAAASSMRSDLLLRIPVLSIEYSDPAARRKSRLFVDGALAGLAENTLRINPGHHVLAAVNGNLRAQVEVDLVEGEKKPAFLDFGANASPTPATATVPAATAPGASDMGEARHAAPVEQARPISTTAYVLAGGALVGIASGTIFGLNAKHQRNRLSEACAPQCTAAAVSQVDRMSKISNVSFAIGLGSGIGAVIAYFATPKEASPSDSLDAALRAPRFDVGVAFDETGPFATVNGAF